MTFWRFLGHPFEQVQFSPEKTGSPKKTQMSFGVNRTCSNPPVVHSAVELPHTHPSPFVSRFAAEYDSPRAHVCANVAANTIRVATITQRVLGDGCRGGGLQWNQHQHVCREAGGHVTTNIVRVGFGRANCRRRSAIGHRHYFGVSPPCDGTIRPRTANEDGIVLALARQRKERTYRELVGPRARARLVVLAGEVADRSSEETKSFASQLAKARGRNELAILRKRAEQAWRMRWMSILGCSAAKAFANSLLNLKAGGTDGETPNSHDVMGDVRASEINMV